MANKVGRSVHGLRDAMFDVLDNLREGTISLRQARMQMEAAKTICLTVAYERQEIEILHRQIELSERIKVIDDKRQQKVIEHE